MPKPKEYQNVRNWADIAEYRGHNLRRDEDGYIDHWAVESEFHNGPACETCGDSWCEHCTAPSAIRPCEGR